MPKKNVAKKTDATPSFLSSAKDLPATQGMLQLVRAELKADIRSLSSEMKAGFNQIDSKFSQVDSKFSQVDSRFNQVDSKLERVLSDVARIGVIVEEQNANNRVVLEGLTGFWQRQERVETRVDEWEKLLRSIAQLRP
ncbi:hypothetical protein WDW86_21410 [Bdellovibrionota bacterium FG-2]